MPEAKNARNQSEMNQVVQTILRYVPYWPLFLICVALSLVVAYVKLRAEQPIFVATAKVLLKDPNKGTTDSKLLDELNMNGERKVVENEILVLRSSGLMQEVVRRLNLATTVYNEGRIRIEELYKESSPVFFTPLNRNSINPGGKYYFDVDWQKGEVHIDNKAVGFNGTVEIAGTAYRVIANPAYNRFATGKNYYAVFNSIDGAAGAIIGSMAINPISPTSSVLDVQLNTAVPERGRNILDTLFDVYNEYSIFDKNQTAAKTLSFIEDRLTNVALSLDSIEQGVVDYKHDNSVFDLQSQAENYFKQTNEFAQQKNDVDLKLTVLNNVRKYVMNGGTVPSLGTLDDATLGGLLGKLAEANTRLEQVRAVNGEKSDAVILARQQLATLRQNILDNLNSIQNTLLTTRNSFNRIIGKNNSLLRSNPQKEKAFAAISRQQAVKNTIFNYLLEKREETALNSASTIADLRVLESASYYGPISPVPKSFYTKWLFIGLVVPAGFVFLKDILNRKVQDRDEIEQKTSIPVVAEIAQVATEDSAIVIGEGRRTAIAEQFRMLRTNLLFLGLTEKSNTILVTSSGPGEGKSFTAINLAISFALTGKKVALLEMDLRKPKISKMLGLEQEQGISNYLVNQASLEQIIKATEISTLSLVQCGPIPPNPAELILKDRFRQLMAELRDRFEFIIVDTAPVGPVADAFLLKEYVDATVLLVRQNVTLKGQLRVLEALKQEGKFKNVCIAFNGLRKRGFAYGNYRYGSYGYGGSYYIEGEAQQRKGLARFFRRSSTVES